LASLAIVDAIFNQGLADTLNQTTMHLTFDDHRINDGAKVVDRSETI
jgi:hypothetical protein